MSQPLSWSRIKAEGERFQTAMTLAEPAVPLSFLKPLEAILSAKPSPQRRDGQYIVSTPDGRYLKATLMSGTDRVRVNISVVDTPDEATHLPAGDAAELGRQFFKRAFRQRQVVLHT